MNIAPRPRIQDWPSKDRRLRSLLVGPFCILVLGILTALGEASGSDLLDLSIEELLQVEVTGATLTSESILSAPAAVSVFKRDEIAQLGVTTLDELLRFAPGFQSFRRGDEAFGEPYSARGRNGGARSGEVLVLLNGRRVNSSIFGGAPSSLPQLSLLPVDRVEIMRGSGSTLYGSNAFLGVINIVTAEGLDMVEVSFGTDDLVDLSLLRQIEVGGWDVQLFVRGFEHGGTESTVTGTFSHERIRVSPETRGYDVMARASWRDTTLDFQSARRWAPGFFRLGVAEPDGLFAGSTQHKIGLEQRVDWGRAGVSTARLGYRWWIFKSETLLSPEGVFFHISDPQSMDPLRDRSVFDEMEFQGQLVHDWQVSDSTELIVGAEIRVVRLDNILLRANFSQSDLFEGRRPVRYASDFSLQSPFLSDESRDVRAVFVQLQHDWGNSHEITLGARYDHYTDEGSRLSPRVGWVWHASERATFKLVYGEAFRVASFVELYSINNPVGVGNADLLPEVVQSWDLIGIWHDERHAISLGFFHNRFDRGIILETLGGRRVFTNGGLEENLGFEVEYQVRFNEHWSVRASGTRIVNPLDGAYREADSFGALALNFERKGWNANLATLYQGSRERRDLGSDQKPQLPAVLELNLNLRYQRGDWTWELRLINILGRSNSVPPLSENARQNIPGRGRSLRVGVEYAF